MATDFQEKYLLLRDENTALKKKKNEQEATIKRMYTKLAMIEETLKKKRQTEENDNQQDPETEGKASVPVRRDLDTERFINTLKNENITLRKKNQSLLEKNRLLEETVRQYKLKPHSVRPTAPSHSSQHAIATKALSGSGKKKQQTLQASARAPDFHSLTLDKQIENARKLHHDTFSGELEQALKNRLVIAEKQVVKLQKENEKLRSGAGLSNPSTHRKRSNNNDSNSSDDDELDEDHQGSKSSSTMEIEQLKRELRDRQAQLSILNARYDNLESNAAAEREIQEKTLDQMETMNRQVHKLRTQLQDANMERENLEGKAAKATELEKEIALIRDQNCRLEERMTTLCESPFINDAFQRKERIDKIFDLEKLNEQQKVMINHMTEENQKLQVINKELQSNIKLIKQAKDSIGQEMVKLKQHLNEERNARSVAVVRATTEISVSELPRDAPKRPQITIPTEPEKRDACSSPVRIDQPQTATQLINSSNLVVSRRYDNQSSMATPFLDIEENGNSVKHLRNRVHVLQMAHLKAMQELERCEKMLHAQTNINRELALEIEDLTSRKVSASSVLQSRIKELELLAEERQQRIYQLEAQIRQLKYARAKLLQKSRLSDDEPNFNSSDDEDESSDVESISESLIMSARDLAPGEQLLEVLIISGNFDRSVVSGNASTFILCDFYDFESQTTPLLMGSRPEYSFSSTFKVTVDGFFLRYLASETLVLEVHQAVRGDFKLIGRALVRLSDLLQSKGVLKEHTLPIKSIQGHADGKVMGTLSVVLRLSCPISEIWRLHLRSYPQDIQLLAREKKHDSQLSEADFLLDEADDEDSQKHQVNELQITIFGCKNLRSYGKKKGNSLSRIPSSYVHYQLLGFPDVFTNIVPETTTPEYDLECSRQSFVMEIDACLLRFFAKFRLWLTVFDDQIELDGDDKDDGMIGRCGVLLSELTNGETIRGWFPLLDRGDHPAGEISVLVQWKDPFQVLQFISSRRARGALNRPMDLHILDFDQQHSVMKLFSPEMDGWINYRQFINFCLPSESLELVTSKIKERFEYAIDTQQINSIEDAFKAKRDSINVSPRMEISDFAAEMEKYGIFLSDAEMEIVKAAFAPLKSGASDGKREQQQLQFIALHYFLQHVNPRASCSSRLLTHKLRHTARGFLQQQKQKKPSEFLSSTQVFEKYDFEQSGQISRAVFKRCLLVFGFELLDIEKEYKDLIKAAGTEFEVVAQSVAETSAPKKKTKVIDLDIETLTDSKAVPNPTERKPKPDSSRPRTEDSLNEVEFVKVSKPASSTTVSAAGEFQQRKQAFIDRMKAIATTSSKSLVYEQLEKKHEQCRIETTTSHSANLPRMDLINQQISRLHAPQAIHHDAAKTVQNQYRLYRAARQQHERILRCSILDADFQLQKMFKNWTLEDLESLGSHLVHKVESEIPEATKARTISRKQLGFVLSQTPRVAIDPALLNQLMEYFSVSSTSPRSLVAYQPMIHFICSVATTERVQEHETQHPVLKVLNEMCLSIPHALSTFASAGDMKSTGVISIKRFRDVLQRLGIKLSAKDLRVVLILFDYNGAEFLYHAFLHMVERSDASLRLAQALSRCQSFGLFKLREKLLMHVNSEDGLMTKQDLHAALTQQTSEFARFDARDAHALFQMMNAEPNSDAKVLMNDLFVRLESAMKHENNPINMEEMSRYNVKKLRKLVWNCRKLTCKSHGDLVSEFERFDWKEQGVVSLDEFVAVTEQRGFQALTQLQLKQIAKCFGSKTNGRFVINYRQFLDWATPSPPVEIGEIESKLRKFAHAQAEHIAGMKVTQILSNWRQSFVSADTMNRGFLSRSEFVKVAKESLQMPLSDEELRVLLYSYDRSLEDQVEYEAFVQLSWSETSKSLRARQVRFDKQTVPIPELIKKLRGKFESSKDSGSALLDSFFESVGENSKWIDGSKFALCFKQLGMMLSSDEIRVIFETFGEKPDNNKLDYELFVRKTLNLPVNSRGERQEHQLKKDGEERLTSALSTAVKYSRDKFLQAYQKFQEVCVVYRFSDIEPSVFWKHMESSGFVELLSRKGVGLLSQKFLITYKNTSKWTVGTDNETEEGEVISLKAVHSFLREFGQKDTESSSMQTFKPQTENSTSSATTVFQKLLRYCSDASIDFRGEFEEYDTKYSGCVTAMQFKQVILDLGISKFSEKSAPEAEIGQLVRQFRSSDRQDAVSYTFMLHHAILSSSIPPELEWYFTATENLRARIRLKAGFSGKLDFGNPSLYTQLNGCFAHFDRTGKGFLTAECLQQGLAALKYNLPTTQVHQLITHMGMFRTGVTCISRMEFDSFALDPYAVSTLEKLVRDLFVVDSGRHGEVIPRIAQLSCALLSRDSPKNRGVLPKQVFWSCLEEILDTKLPQMTKLTLQHLFDVNRNGMIAYRLFMKVLSQWQKGGFDPTSMLSCEERLEKAGRAPRAQEVKPSRCSYQDLLRSLYNQLSSLDFDSQVDIVEEHLQRKDPGHTGVISRKHLMRVFDQIGLLLSKSAEESLPHFFSDGGAGDKEFGGEVVILYEKIISALKKMHKQREEQDKAADRKSDSRRTASSCKTGDEDYSARSESAPMAKARAVIRVVVNPHQLLSPALLAGFICIHINTKEETRSMFWRRKKSDANGQSGNSSRGGKQQNEDGGDDITKLQRQFGIKPVSDADVQAEFQKLFGAGGGGAASATGLSPRSELLLFGGAGAEDDDDEASILRALNIKGTSVDKLDIDGLDLSDDDEDEEGEGQDAKHELKGVLKEVHTTAVHYQNQNDPMQMYSGAQTRIETRTGGAAGGNNQEEVAARVQELKRQAITLKREGKVKEALALFRQAKELEAAPVLSASGGGGPTARIQPQQQPPAVVPRVAVESAQYDHEDDDDDVEVTDEDMQDPEFLAQLAKMGLHGDTQPQKSRLPIETIASIEAQIQDAKQQAVERKRNNQIPEALQWMRRIKELEATLARLREEEGEDATASSHSSALTTVTTTRGSQSVAVTRTEETITMKHAPADRVVTAHAYTSAAANLNEEDDGILSDVEVTENDMEDPAFAEELRKLGFNPSEGGASAGEDSSGGDPDSSAAPTANNATAQSHSHTASAYNSAPAFRSALSIGDEDLIDEFDEDEDDSDAPLSYSSSLTTAATGGYGTLSTTQVAVAPVAHAPPPPPPEHQPTQQEQADLTDLENQLQHAKETAIRLKREGNIKEALETMRRVKQIETLIEHKKQRKYVPQPDFALPVPPVIQQDPVTAARFHELEQLLVDFGNRALALAKENLSVDRAEATEWLNKRKEYAGELDKLRAKRQNPLQPPPPFKVEKISREVEVELTDIPADQVVVNVHSVNDLRAMAGRDIFVKFCLNFPAATPHEGKTSTLRVSSNAPYSTGKIAQQNQFRFPVQRSRGTQRLLEIKKAHFEVWTAGTFLRSPELVARGYQELAPFLSTCQVNCCVPFVGSNRKPTGGNVEISIRFRTPLKDKEMKIETTEELRVGEYPAPLAASAAPPATTASNVTSASSFAEVVKTDSPNAPPSTELVASDDMDAADPHHPDLIISYDVINEELEKIEAKLPSLQGQAAIELSDRFDSLSLKKQFLEIDMQTGKLTLDMYVEKLQARIKEDRQLIAKLMKAGRRMDAARVLHRVKIMEKELVVGGDDESNEGASAM